MNSSVDRVRAIVADPGAPSGWSLGEAPAPEPGPGRAVVAVRHASLNHGDLRYAALVAPGTVLGWDASGIVVAGASDGSGPPAGTPVVAFGGGAWAQRAAFEVGQLTPVGPAADLAPLAALPLAGVSALRALRAAGTTLGRRVLVTGASGGVGRFAVQLAAIAGAEVIASVGSAGRGAGLAAVGADRVVVGLDGVDGPLDVVVDTVGGPQLVAAYGLLGPGGSIQSVGWSSGEPAVLEPYVTFGPSRVLASMSQDGAFGPDLAVLVDLVLRGRLVVELGWRGGWERIDEAAAALVARQVAGKAVLDIAGEEGRCWGTRAAG